MRSLAADILARAGRQVRVTAEPMPASDQHHATAPRLEFLQKYGLSVSTRNAARTRIMACIILQPRIYTGPGRATVAAP